MKKINLSLGIYDEEDNLTRGLKLEFLPEESGMYRPVITIKEETGFENVTKFPPGTLNNLKEKLVAIIEKLNPQNAESFVRKIGTFLSYMR